MCFGLKCFVCGVLDIDGDCVTWAGMNTLVLYLDMYP